MLPSVLIPLWSSVELDALEQKKDHFLLQLRTTASSASCPSCSQLSTHKQGTYIRNFQDLPWAGIRVKVNLCVKKFYCKDPACPQKVFAQRFGKDLPPYARRTARLTDQLTEISYLLGGNGGSKLATMLGIAVSCTTLLRILYQAAAVQEIPTPRVLGIDDWAFRKGQTYGTILVDLEQRKPIDLLPDREMETVKKWLEAHPGIEIISRDRASCYSQAAELGAPEAIQVADRWHLLKNLGDALKRMLDQDHQALRLTAKELALAQLTPTVKELAAQSAELVASDPQDLPAEELSAMSKYELNFLEVKRLKAEGHSIRSIHRQTGIHRQTINKYLKYEQYPPKAIPDSQASLALPFEAYLRKRWQEGETNHKALWREIKAQGFTGSAQSVYRLVSKYPKDAPANKLPPPLKVKTWSARKVSLLMSQPFEDQDEETQTFLRTLYRICPAANTASQLARKFKDMTDRRRKRKLDAWIETAQNSGIPAMKNFAKGILQDYDAVKAAVSMKWSNGQVEGQVNRLKNIKRQMYGRASFELLRKRVLRRTG